VATKQLQTFIIALVGVFIFCVLTFFPSLKAGVVLVLPLAVSNFLAYSYMAIFQIGLTISTLPVSAIGIGLGVDFGIYLLSRYNEELKIDSSINGALIRTIQSYSKSIINIAVTLVLGLLVWTVSGLKFQAQMGLMLAMILFFNCAGAVFLVPVLVIFTKYRG